MGSRVLGLLRDIILFAYLGASAINSAFIFAFTLPNLFRRLLGEGALSSAIVPVFSSEYEESGKEAAFVFLNQALTWVSILLIALVIIGCSSLFGIGCCDGLEQRWYIGCELAMVLFPYVLFVCLAAVIGAALNVFERFAMGALSQVWLNLSMIFFLGILGGLFTNTVMGKVYFLCAGVLVGGVIQVLVPIKTLLRMGWKPRLDFSLSGGLLELSKLVIPGLAGAVIFQVNMVVSQLLAFSLNDKSVSILYLANRLIEFPLGVFTIAVTTVLFPSITRLVVQNKWLELTNEYQRGLSLIFAITIPAMVGLIVLHEPILGLLFEWGRFDAEDVNLTSPILMIFSFALPFYSLSTFATRGFHALKDMKTPYRLSIFIFILNVILSLILMFPLGIKGLAISNVSCAIINAILLQYFLAKKEKHFSHSNFLETLFKIIFAAGAMGLLILGFDHLILTYLNHGKLHDILAVGLGIPLAMGCYFLILKLLKFEELELILSFFKKSELNLKKQ